CWCPGRESSCVTLWPSLTPQIPQIYPHKCQICIPEAVATPAGNEPEEPHARAESEPARETLVGERLARIGNLNSLLVPPPRAADRQCSGPPRRGSSRAPSVARRPRRCAPESGGA